MLVRKPIRVLLVDLRPVVARVFKGPMAVAAPRLELIGHARSYAVSLALARELHPDVILFGIFPDPLDALEVITALTQSCTARILILKSLYESVSVGKAIEAGAHGLVPREGSAELIGAAIADAHEDTAPLARGSSDGYFSLPLSSWRLDPDQEKLSQLTLREKEVISAIAADPAAKYISIADRLGISEHTVHNHLSRIYHKLNVVNRIDLLVYAFRHGLAQGNPPRHTDVLGVRGLQRHTAARALRAGAGELPPPQEHPFGAGTPRG